MKNSTHDLITDIGIEKALAGHAARVQGFKTAKKYDNPLTDFVNLIIAEHKAKAK